MRKLLLTTDGSESSLRAAAYLAGLYKDTADAEVTVLHISPSIPPIYTEEIHDSAIRKKFETWKTKKEEEGQRYLAEVARVLKENGFPAERVQTRYSIQMVGVARDIIREADSGRYDAVLMGKKGMGWLEEHFLGTISNKLLEIAEGRPLWIVEGKDLNPKKVLIALDADEAALEVTRFAGRMLQGLKGVEILLFHFCGPYCEILDPPKSDEAREVFEYLVNRERGKVSAIFAQAQKILSDAGFGDSTVEVRFEADTSLTQKKASRQILAAAAQGNFGTVILGRKGITRAREFRLGSICLRTVAEAENCAVWVV
ncbi:MAG: universal stress protein [Syntrophaceae bacterium]|jgi:nucleotide-binding universal stress UspA family protein|nr:universal stress protein [Syntrophaceae bacterium]